MKSRKLLLLIPVLAIIAFVWLLAVTSMTDDPQKKDKLIQDELVKKADAFVADEIYSRAIPLYEEACGYKTDNTFDISYKLQTAYYNSGNYDSYYELLIERCGNTENNVSEEEYVLLAEYYFDTSDYAGGMAVLNKGIADIDSDELKSIKEEHRYDYYDASGYYTEMVITASESIPVSNNGRWAYINSNGGKVFNGITFDKITPFLQAYEYDGETRLDTAVFCAMVTIDGVHQFIDSSGNRYSLCKGKISDIVGVQHSGYAIAIDSDGKYVLTDSEFRILSDGFDYLGTYSDGMYITAVGNKYGSVNNQLQEVLAPAYDSFALNDYGEAFNSDRAFVMKSGKYSLIDYTGTAVTGEAYDDACAFYRNSELAAVCKNGKWGFVDTSGNLVIDYKYDDATSFCNGLAAVSVNGKWGYINESDSIAIKCQYERAFPFMEKGTAQVLTDEGYKLIKLNWTGGK